jgi:hypothetical protein
MPACTQGYNRVLSILLILVMLMMLVYINFIHQSFFRLNRLNTGVSPMNKTTKISGASVNLTTPRCIGLNKTTHGKSDVIARRADNEINNMQTRLPGRHPHGECSASLW